MIGLKGLGPACRVPHAPYAVPRDWTLEHTHWCLVLQLRDTVTTIICTQSQILVKLGVSNVDFKKLLELRSMLRLKVLNFDNIVTLDELVILKNQLPHLNINEDGPKAMKLRIPYPVGDLRLLKTLKRLHTIKYSY